jgi:hypothetical protein
MRGNIFPCLDFASLRGADFGIFVPESRHAEDACEIFHKVLASVSRISKCLRSTARKHSPADPL